MGCSLAHNGSSFDVNSANGRVALGLGERQRIEQSS